jgi:hypothetical protein
MSLHSPPQPSFLKDDNMIGMQQNNVDFPSLILYIFVGLASYFSILSRNSAVASSSEVEVGWKSCSERPVSTLHDQSDIEMHNTHSDTQRGDSFNQQTKEGCQ